MLRDEAVRRIDDALGFRTTGHSLTAAIVSRLQEAQNELENGKTLPPFLLAENYTLALLVGARAVAKPPGFLRESDETLIRRYEAGSDFPLFLARKYFIDAYQAYSDGTTAGDPGPPLVYVMRKDTINFVTAADQEYSLYLDYYKAADPLTSNIENVWLADAVGKWWLIGEAGMKIAADLRDQNAATIFSAMASKARTSLFSKIVDDELAGGPLMMGANL